MNHLFKCFLFVLFLGLAMKDGRAQIQVHLGATTSVNATFVLDKGLSEDPRYSSTYTYKWSPVGFNFGVDFGRKFGLSLESILSKQGQIYDMINKAKEVSGERKIDVSYLNLPLLMRFMGGGNGGTRANFNLGPQLSILTSAVETIQAKAGTYEIPEGTDFATIQNELASTEADKQYIQQLDANTYQVTQDLSPKDLLTKKANDFKNSEFQIAAAFGLDIDLSKHLYLTTQIRANYSLTDMRNGDVIEALKDGNNIFGQRANLLIGVQLGLHYMFGTTRSFKFKQ
ncbi:MAG: outer membrane beta-barrel protein [Bacteroidota bacterium]